MPAPARNYSFSLVLKSPSHLSSFSFFCICSCWSCDSCCVSCWYHLQLLIEEATCSHLTACGIHAAGKRDSLQLHHPLGQAPPITGTIMIGQWQVQYAKVDLPVVGDIEVTETAGCYGTKTIHENSSVTLSSPLCTGPSSAAWHFSFFIVYLLHAFGPDFSSKAGYVPLHRNEAFDVEELFAFHFC